MMRTIRPTLIIAGRAIPSTIKFASGRAEAGAAVSHLYAAPKISLSFHRGN